MLGTTPKPHVARATYDLQVKARQDAFLEAYASLGNITDAATAVGISRESVRLWTRDNDLGFKDRFTEANQAYGDYLRGLARKRLENPSGHVGGDILLIAGIAAHGNPEWRIQQDRGNTSTTKVQVTTVVIHAPPGADPRVIEALQSQVSIAPPEPDAQQP